MQGPSLSQCFKKVPDVAASPRATPPPPPHPDRRIPATCCGDKPIRRGRMKRGEEQPLGGARADISRALFPSGPGAGFGCRVLWSSVRHREPLSVALRLHTLDPSPTASDRAGAQAEWGGEGKGARGRASDVRIGPSQRPRARTRGLPFNARPFISFGVLGGWDTENASWPPPSYPARKRRITKPSPSGSVA